MVVNTLYFDNNVLKSAKNIYNKQIPKNIRLMDFFQNPVFLLLQKKLYNAKYKLKFHPYKYKYSIAKVKEIDSFLKGQYFNIIIDKIIGKSYTFNYEIRKFCHANCTLLHDAEKKKPGVDFILDMSKADGNYGGYITYLTKSEELLHLNPCQNTLSFVERKKDVVSYTKYVQYKQKYPIVYVTGTIFKQ